MNIEQTLPYFLLGLLGIILIILGSKAPPDAWYGYMLVFLGGICIGFGTTLGRF
jgi:drug/metabolite transporter (DMT)-like permease